MRRRSFIHRFSWALAGTLSASSLASLAGERASALRVDTRPESLVRELVSTGEPAVATKTEGGLVLDYASEGRKLRFVEDALAATAVLQLSRGNAWWRYEGLRDPLQRALVLQSYANSLTQTVYRLDAFDAVQDPEGTRWFRGHERQMQRMGAVLGAAALSAWPAGAATVRARVAALRTELDVEAHAEVSAGEATRIMISGAREETSGDSVELRRDLVKDTYWLRVRLVPREGRYEGLRPHAETLVLSRRMGAPSGSLSSYDLASWKDESLGLTWTTGRGGAHPRYLAKEQEARVLVGFFPRLV